MTDEGGWASPRSHAGSRRLASGELPAVAGGLVDDGAVCKMRSLTIHGVVAEMGKNSKKGSSTVRHRATLGEDGDRFPGQVSE